MSGQITDAGSQAWNNGTYSFVFVPNPQYPVGPYTWTGGTLNTTISGSLNATGGYSVSIPSNTSISPVGSKWTATFCPQASSGCFTVSNISVTGGTQTVNATPPSILINLQLGVPPILAYSTSEVTGAVTGSQFYLLGTGLQVCSAVSGNNCTTWGSASGNSVGSGAAPIMALYFSNQCPVANTGQCFFTASNTQIANDCTWASSGTTVTCATSHFAAGDVGKRIMGYFKTDSFGSTFGCVAGRVSFSSMTTGTLTIASFTSGTQISLSANPSNTATSNNGCVVWGTPDDSNASTFETAYAAIANFCPKVMLAAAGYWFSSPHFFSLPTGCVALSTTVGSVSASYGNMVYAGGFELEGRGPGNTVIYLGPDFPNGDTCAHATGGVSACFVVVTEGKWKDLQISGGAQLTCQVSTGKVLFGVGVGTMENITLTNMCNTQASQTIGIQADLLAQLYQVNNSGWGSICFQNTATTGAEIYAYKLACENSPGSNLSTATNNEVTIVATPGFFPTFTCNGCLLVGAIAVPGGGNVVGVAANAEVHLVNTIINNCEAASGCSTGGSLMVKNSGRLYLTEDELFANGAVSGVGGVNCALAGCITYMEKTTITAGNSATISQAYLDAGGGTLVDLGGNVGLFSGPTTQLTGAVQSDGRSIMFSCTGTANASVTNSLYNTGPNITATTCAGQTSTLGTGIPFQQARTISGIICTSSATTVSVACTVMLNGVAQTNTCTMTAATRCIDFSHPISVNPADLLSAKIVTGAAETGANIKMQVIWQ